MKNVLFIVHDLYQDDNEFPLGIGYLASALQKRGHNVTIACQDLYHWSNEELAEKYLKNHLYDIIGLSFMSARFVETIIPLCSVINKYRKSALLVLGGHGPSATPEYVLKKLNADVVVVGEGDETIVDIAEKPLSDIKGIVYMSDGNIIKNEPRELIKHLDTIPFPAWDLFPMDRYTDTMLFPGQEKKEKSFPIISSRGCTNRCAFCYRLTKGIRFRSIQNVMDEMKILYEKYNVSYFVLQDELFAASLKRLKAFVQGLKDNDLYGKVKYAVGGLRADLVTDDLAILLKESNCEHVSIGFESVEQKILDELQKNTTVEDNFRCAEILKKHNVIMKLNFIWGAPSDNKETLNKSVAFIKKYNTYGDLRTIRPITPYPVCPFYNLAVKKGKISEPEDFYNKFLNSDLITVNFTDIPDNECYKMLYQANSELIDDHVKHTDMTQEAGDEMKDAFHKLYFEGYTKFRGARHNVKE
jgi:radical SAM superfamily enzyme YgiQ (UPF0313 family)